MKKSLLVLACFGCLCLTSSAFGQAAAKGSETGPARESLSANDSQMPEKLASNSKYAAVEKYDPLRDADKDIQNAMVEAQRTNRRVLLEIGGLWCKWCTYLDEFFEKQRDVLALRDKYFVTLKINFSDENKNEEVLSRYPAIGGYPHIFVLDAQGKFLHSQDTGVLEEGKGYSISKVTRFLNEWAPASPKKAAK